MTTAASSVSAAARARTIVAQRAADFTRELGGLGAPSTDTYTAGWVGWSQPPLGGARRRSGHGDGGEDRCARGRRLRWLPRWKPADRPFARARAEWRLRRRGRGRLRYRSIRGSDVCGSPAAGCSAGDASPATFVSAVAHGVLRSDSRATGLAAPGRLASAWTSRSRSRKSFEASLEGAARWNVI